MTYSEDELRAMIAGMRNASAAFYGDARRIGCHQFIEFCGLMNEFIGLCEDAVAKGQDFTETSIHGDGKPLPMRPHHRAYLNEKLECIYGHSLDAIMGGEMTIKRYNPSVTLMENCVAVVQMIPADDGIVVRWEDHAAAIEEYEGVQQALCNQAATAQLELREAKEAIRELQAERDAAVRATRRPTLNEMVLQIAAEGYAVLSVADMTDEEALREVRALRVALKEGKEAEH